MLSEKQFTSQLYDLKEQYRKDNAWIGKFETRWDDKKDSIVELIWFAYKLYRATVNHTLKLTVLGGENVRMNQHLINSFGVTGINGIQDKITKDLIQKELELRIKKFGQNHSFSNVDNLKKGGTILSEKGWTPILNDALIIGAITGRQQIALALTENEQAAWDTVNGEKVTKFAGIAACYDDTAAKEMWKDFFNSQTEMFFYKNGNPRVFTRELLGLSFFGYKAHFTPHQLSFGLEVAKKIPDFKTYLSELHRLQFHAPTNKANVMGAISEFLFGDKKALG